MNHVAANSVALWANGFITSPPIGYRVTVSAEYAFLYAVAAGFCLAMAAAAAGFWLIRHRTLTTFAGRLTILVAAGCLSIGWVAALLWQHRDRNELLPLDGVWSFAERLPWVWYTTLGVLLIGGYRQASRQRQQYIRSALAGAVVGYICLLILANLENRQFYTIRSIVTGKTAPREIMDHPADPWVLWGLLIVFVGGGAGMGVLKARRHREPTRCEPTSSEDRKDWEL